MGLTGAWRRYRPCGLVLLFVLVWSFFVATGSPALAQQSAQTVKVAVIDYPNYLQMGEDGTVSGYAYEYLQSLKQYTGWTYQFVEMNFADATEALAKGEIDLLPGNQYTENRASLYDYSARDMGEGGSVLCVLPENSRYCYNDYASYDGIRIAALKGSVRIEQARTKLAAYGATAVFSEYETDEESKAALESGAVDAVLMSTIRCEERYKILARLNTAPLYFCTNRQRPELKATLDEAMEALHLDHPYYEEELDKKYYGSIPVQLAFTQEEKDYIATVGEITVAVSDDLIPVEYLNKNTGVYDGLVPDFFRLMEKNSGLRFRFVTRSGMEATQAQMANGEVQLVASVANEPEIAEQWGVKLSSAYFSNSLSLVIGSAVDNYRSSACTLVLRAGYPFLKQVALAEGYTNLIYADSFDACIELVNKRQADLTLIPSNCAESLVHRAAYAALSTYMVPGSYIDFCMGVPENADPLLLSVLNKSIASISQEQQTELLVQNLAGISETVTWKDFIAAHKVTILMAVLVVALLLIAGISHLALVRTRTNRRLAVALEKADAANRAKTDFLSRMSHDMRTPMNGILGLSYLMERENDLDTIKRDLPRLRESGEYLLQLINDVLDVNKVESGKIELHPKVCDEKQLFDNIVAMVSPQIAEKGLNFHFEKKNIEWTYLLLDEQRVKQIFINLLTNAIKFTPPGGTVTLTMEMVSKSETMLRDKFVVHDTGIGMGKDFLPHLFEPFAQENRIQEGLGGTGLGLSIVKNLVELMGGTISVESEIDKGSTFTLYLDFPLAQRPEQPVQEDTVQAIPALAQGTKVLLCEDHPLNAKIVIRLLESKGVTVLWKENGKLGVDAFEASAPHEFDAILMDIRMPVMNGIEATRVIRQMPRADATTIPILAMTANAFEEDVRNCLDAGMNAHLAKPVEPNRLYAVLAQEVAKGRRNMDAATGKAQTT